MTWNIVQTILVHDFLLFWLLVKHPSLFTNTYDEQTICQTTQLRGGFLACKELINLQIYVVVDDDTKVITKSKARWKKRL